MCVFFRVGLCFIALLLCRCATAFDRSPLRQWLKPFGGSCCSLPPTDYRSQRFYDPTRDMQTLSVNHVDSAHQRGKSPEWDRGSSGSSDLGMVDRRRRRSPHKPAVTSTPGRLSPQAPRHGRVSPKEPKEPKGGDNQHPVTSKSNSVVNGAAPDFLQALKARGAKYVENCFY